MRWDAQTRAVTVGCGLVALFSVYSFRLIELQLVKHEEYSARAAEKHVHKQAIYAKRGTIRDVHDEILANNLPVETVVGDSSLIREPMAVAEAIAHQLEMDPRELAAKLGSGAKYLVLKQEVSEARAEEIRTNLQAARLKGVRFEPDFKRMYPNGSLLAQVVGFVDHKHQGVMGIERTMQEFLQGADGFRYIEIDRTGRELVPYRGLEKPARDGCDVTLTIDLGLQSIVEQELEAACAQYRPERAVAVMMRPSTGEILAMTSRPSFDLNAAGESTPEQQKNGGIVEMVEPGSTFKIVATSAALEEKLVTPDTTVFCENGRFQYAGRILRDAHPMGVLTVHQILAKSSNIGVAKLALQLGEAKLYEYVRKFGFGERTGVALTGEIPGLVIPLDRWGKLEITRVPMGQSVAVTPLQMVAAMSAVANEGKLMKPLVVTKIIDPKGRPVVTFAPEVVRQVVSPQTTKKIVSALKDVVSKQGTAQKAAVKGFSVAGKTGTAQKVDPKGGYYQGRYITSFVGFMPAEDPKFTLLVMLDDPKTKPGEAYGGLVAGPIFARMAERAANYLDLRPTEPTQPDARMTGNPKKEALTAAMRD
ncbi:MAG: penicillin-binding protein 2 [Verrucomicrobia bacterium]|nr:penicillin-binding protein 2 [Verrucomicrobiota bacterium]